ncbi:MAG: endonuclease, partial [Omnitrophica WOR_2 bacterium RIFCSPLOWO2_12_FULL_46_30]
WPGETPFEVIVGAILTQNTNWQNVESAINNLKKAKVLNPRKLYSLPLAKLARLIRPSGYYNIKARRLRSFLDFLFKNYGGSLKKMFSRDLDSLRRQILNVKGVGPETADSILLYAGGYPVFVVDAYTKRIFSRKKLISENTGYHQAQGIFMRGIKKDAGLYNEYHALIVRLGKEICKKNNPKCETCPIR